MAQHVRLRSTDQAHCIYCCRRVSPRDCLSVEARVALARYMIEHGARWRSALLAEWASGNCSQPLMEARNILGPSGLAKIKTATLARVLQAQKEV